MAMMTFLPEIPALCAEKTIMEMSGFAGTIRSKEGITAMAPANMGSVGMLVQVR